MLLLQGNRRPRESRLRCIGAVVILGMILLLVSPAQASLFLVFKGDGSRMAPSNPANGEGGVGAPGQRIEARKGGQGAMGDIKTMPAFLTPPTHVPSRRSLHSRMDVFSLGRIVANAEANGLLEFTVPEVKPGIYQIVVFCPECTSFSAGRSVLPVAPFRVVRTPLLPATGSSHPAPVGIALLVIALGALALALAKKESAHNRACSGQRGF